MFKLPQSADLGRVSQSGVSQPFGMMNTCRLLVPAAVCSRLAILENSAGTGRCYQAERRIRSGFPLRTHEVIQALSRIGPIVVFRELNDRLNFGQPGVGQSLLCMQFADPLLALLQ